MADPGDVARIREYLKQHQTTYTKDALRARLVADGHPAEAIDLAFAQEYGLAVAGPPLPRPASRTRTVLIAIGVCLVNFVALPLLIGLASEYVTLNNLGGFVLASIGLFVLALILEGGIAAIVRRQDPALSRGLAWGLGLSLLPLVGGALILGLTI